MILISIHIFIKTLFLVILQYVILHIIEDIIQFYPETLISGNSPFSVKMLSSTIMGNVIFLTRFLDGAMNENKWCQFVSKATLHLL